MEKRKKTRFVDTVVSDPAYLICDSCQTTIGQCSHCLSFFYTADNIKCILLPNGERQHICQKCFDFVNKYL